MVASRTQSGWIRPVTVRLYLSDVCGVFSFARDGVGYGTGLEDRIQDVVAVRIRPQLREKGGEVMDAGNLTAGAETPFDLFKIRPQSSRKLGSQGVSYRISCDGL